MPDDITSIANTIDEAPRNPAHDTSPICPNDAPNGARSAIIVTGLAINVRNNAMNTDVRIISGIICGVARRPSRKNIVICARFVSPSKK